MDEYADSQPSGISQKLLCPLFGKQYIAINQDAYNEFTQQQCYAYQYCFSIDSASLGVVTCESADTTHVHAIPFW